MSLEQIESALLNLSADERRRFAEWFYSHETEITGEDEINSDVKEEILRRRSEAIAHPERLEPWEGTTELIRARLNELRHQKARNR